MLELLFVIGFFVMLMVTGVSLLGIIAALIVATAFMFLSMYIRLGHLLRGPDGDAWQDREFP